MITLTACTYNNCSFFITTDYLSMMCYRSFRTLRNMTNFFIVFQDYLDYRFIAETEGWKTGSGFFSEKLFNMRADYEIRYLSIGTSYLFIPYTSCYYCGMLFSIYTYIIYMYNVYYAYIFSYSNSIGMFRMAYINDYTMKTTTLCFTSDFCIFTTLYFLIRFTTKSDS